MGLERAFQRHVARGAAHQADEVPVLDRGRRVAADVADQLGVDLARRVEAERRLDLLVLHVAVDRLRDADDARLAFLTPQVLGEQRGVRVRIVAADDHQAVEPHLLEVVAACLEVLGLLDLVAPAHDHVEAAGVAVLVDHLGGDLVVLALDDAAGALQEAEELAVPVRSLERIEQPGDDVVPARRLSARQHDADLQRLGGEPAIALNDPHDRLAVAQWEEPLDVRLIGRRMRRLAELDFDIAGLQRVRQLRLILRAVFL